MQLSGYDDDPDVYYSTIGLALDEEGCSTLQSWLGSEDINPVVLTFFDSPDADYLDTGSNAECFYWEAARWNRDDPEYGPIMDFMYRFMTEVPTEHYFFVRCGEDKNDNEEAGWYWNNPFHLHIQRMICMEGTVIKLHPDKTREPFSQGYLDHLAQATQNQQDPYWGKFRTTGACLV